MHEIFLRFLTPSLFPQLLQNAMGGTSDQIWWFGAIALLLLGAAAVVDAFTSRVPDFLILPGYLLLLIGFGELVDWPFAAERLAYGFAAALVLVAINQFWYGLFKNDALGMGDAKWSALAVTAFSFKPVVIAWIVGAWLGVLWLFGAWVVSRVRNSKTPVRVHFAPFLFIGLLIGLVF